MISILMGSDSDLPVVKKTVEILRAFNVTFDVKILSAHRTPELVREYVINAEKQGTHVFIGVAGKAAHLPGVIASFTTVPVIGLPIKTADLQGMDSLLSIVQMPPSVPVATVGIDAGVNAGLLAIQMLAINDSKLKQQLQKYRQSKVVEVEDKNRSIMQLFD